MSKHNKEPRLTLVGAGPGDPDLITVKGLKALQQADVVLYDSLVDQELIDHAVTAKKVYVGKRAGKHYKKQDKINELIVQYAFSYGHVVRLKGGDPFIFGRGHEEKEYAEAFGVDVTAIPAPSSATALATTNGLPLTKRGYSQSFWTVTATTKDGSLSHDIALAAQSSATVVILMGLRKLDDIMAAFAQHGKADDPVAVIQNGTMPDERKVTGTVATIADRVREEGVGSPAVIITGSVVALDPELQRQAWLESVTEN